MRGRFKDESEGDDISRNNPHGGMIEVEWQKIQPRLAARDPNEVLRIWGNRPESIQNALKNRTEEWLIKRLSMPRSAELPYGEDQGLVRLLWMMYPNELPVRAFTMEMLPAIMARMAEEGI